MLNLMKITDCRSYFWTEIAAFVVIRSRIYEYVVFKRAVISDVLITELIFDNYTENKFIMKAYIITCFPIPL